MTATPRVRRPSSAVTYRRLRSGLHEFDAVAEWICNIDTVVPIERLVVLHSKPSCGDSISDAAHVVHDEGRVRLGCRHEVGVDTEVDLQIAVLEPAAAASVARWWGFGT